MEEYSEEQGYGYEEEEGGYEDQDYDSSSLLQQQDSSMSTAGELSHIYQSDHKLCCRALVSMPNLVFYSPESSFCL